MQHVTHSDSSRRTVSRHTSSDIPVTLFVYSSVSPTATCCTSSSDRATISAATLASTTASRAVPLGELLPRLCSALSPSPRNSLSKSEHKLTYPRPPFFARSAMMWPRARGHCRQPSSVLRALLFARYSANNDCCASRQGTTRLRHASATSCSKSATTLLPVPSSSSCDGLRDSTRPPSAPHTAACDHTWPRGRQLLRRANKPGAEGRLVCPEYARTTSSSSHSMPPHSPSIAVP